MNEKLNTQSLVDLLAEKHGMSKKNADGFVKEFFLLIEEALESDRCVKIKGLGTFKLIEVESRESVKVNTGERFQIQGHTKVSFTPDPSLRDTVNKPFAHFETVVLNDNTLLEDTSVEEEQEDESDEAPETAETTISPKEVSDTKEEPVATPVAEDTTPLQTAENIIAAELRKAELEFKTIRLSEVEEEIKPLPPRQTLPPVARKQEKPPTPYLIAIIVMVLLLCSGALLFVYYPDLFSFDNKKELVQVPASEPTVVRDTLLDTLSKDTVAEIVPQVPEEVPTEQQKAAETNEAITKPTEKPDSTNYKIAGTKTTHLVKEGETLIRISQKFYGVKDCWSYIVEHNKDIIKNPDNVPFGTTLKIPELVKK